jgi:undecaprenyl-diphosphatase
MGAPLFNCGRVQEQRLPRWLVAPGDETIEGKERSGPVTWFRSSWIKQPGSALADLWRFARSEAIELVAVAFIAGAALAFVEIADDMTESDGKAFDQYVLETLHPGPDLADPIGPASLDHAVADFTALGSVTVLVFVALVSVGYLLIMKRGFKALALSVALAGGLLLSESLKRIFERDRPPEEYRVAEVLNASFPSGHALMSTVVYLVIGAMLARAMPRRRLRYYVIGVAILMALLVGMSRVYLGVHWATDVLGGWCLGAAWATACWLTERALSGRRNRPASEAR